MVKRKLGNGDIWTRWSPPRDLGAGNSSKDHLAQKASSTFYLADKAADGARNVCGIRKPSQGYSVQPSTLNITGGAFEAVSTSQQPPTTRRSPNPCLHRHDASRSASVLAPLGSDRHTRSTGQECWAPIRDETLSRLGLVFGQSRPAVRASALAIQPSVRLTSLPKYAALASPQKSPTSTTPVSILILCNSCCRFR